MTAEDMDESRFTIAPIRSAILKDESGGGQGTLGGHGDFMPTASPRVRSAMHLRSSTTTSQILWYYLSWLLPKHLLVGRGAKMRRSDTACTRLNLILSYVTYTSCNLTFVARQLYPLPIVSEDLHVDLFGWSWRGDRESSRDCFPLLVGPPKPETLSHCTRYSAARCR